MDGLGLAWRAAALALTTCAAGGALAQDSIDVDQVARVHFERGRNAYDAGRLEEAEREFALAYELSERPELLHNLYLARRDLGDTAGAADALRLFLAESDDVPNRAALSERLAALERAAIEDSGGPPALSISCWVLAAAAGALVVSGSVTLALALDASSELEAGCDSNGACDPELGATIDRGRTSAVLTDVFFSVAAAAGTLGIVFLLLAPGDEALSTSALCDAAGCRIGVRGAL